MNSEKLMSKAMFLLFLTSFTLYLPFLYPMPEYRVFYHIAVGADYISVLGKALDGAE